MFCINSQGQWLGRESVHVSRRRGCCAARAIFSGIEYNRIRVFYYRRYFDTSTCPPPQTIAGRKITKVKSWFQPHFHLILYLYCVLFVLLFACRLEAKLPRKKPMLFYHILTWFSRPRAQKHRDSKSPPLVGARSHGGSWGSSSKRKRESILEKKFTRALPKRPQDMSNWFRQIVKDQIVNVAVMVNNSVNYLTFWWVLLTPRIPMTSRAY